MKSRVTGIGLLFCFIVPVILTFTFLQLHKRAIRREVKHQIVIGIDTQELVLLKFTKQAASAQLHWEHNEEFEYNGQLYDVVKSQTDGDSLYYWCWQDDEETKLNQQLDQLVNYSLGKDQQNQESSKRLTSFFKSLFFTESTRWDTPIFLSDQLNFHFGCRCGSVVFSPPSPPPKMS